MNQTAEPQIQAVSVATPAETDTTRRHLIILALALMLGGVIVWELRQPWAKDQLWLWFLLLSAMFTAANALRELDLWLPGEPVLPKLEKFPKQALTIAGAIAIAIALAMTWLIVRKLLPDYKSLWQGVPQLWLAAMILIVAGAAMLGAVGRGSPRAATAASLWRDSSRTRLWEVIAFIL